jgi:mersacidin/lichenicidin family type 2 lantibiotic
MKNNDIIKAWKDPVFRSTLNAEQIAVMLSHPSSDSEISGDMLRGRTEAYSNGGTAICTPCPPRHCY